MAFEWLQKAAEEDMREGLEMEGPMRDNDMMDANKKLAMCHYEGRGTPPDPTKAVERLRMSLVTDSIMRESEPCTMKLAAMASAPVPTRNSDARGGTVIVVAAAARSAGTLPLKAK